MIFLFHYQYYCIEGNPFITRFKTSKTFLIHFSFVLRIEGNPFITRFKTVVVGYNLFKDILLVLKVIHL